MESPARPALVGRRHEFGELLRALAESRAGRGGTVLIAGEAGIGKTRLASELVSRASNEGFEVLVGHSIDLVGTELPYHPVVEALRPLGPPPPVSAPKVGSQLGVFEETLAMLAGHTAAAPVLLVLEDLHWADSSTLDLVAFLAHNIDDQRILLLATCRAGESASADRVRRLTDGVIRSASALVLELAPLGPDELTQLLARQAGSLPPQAVIDTVLVRSEGNPLFAEELLAAANDGVRELPRRLRDLLLRRLTQLEPATQNLLRLAAAAGREVRYSLLQAVADLPEHDLRECLRQAVEHGVLVALPLTGSFRFRHALIAEASYATILPGEREELHERLAEELARSGATSPAEIVSHWAAAGRRAEALAASVDAARRAELVFGLAEALAHLERAHALWDDVPDSADLARLDRAELLSWAARLASQTGAAHRAVELAREAIDRVPDRHRAALLHVDLGEYLLETGHDDWLAAIERAVEIVPTQPPSAELAYALGSLAGGLMVAWRHEESRPIADQALTLAREVGAPEAEVRALTVLGATTAYLDGGEEGITHLRNALQRAEEIGDRWGLERAYVNLTDALTMRGRPAESAQVGRAAIEVLHRYGVESPVLVANTIEALLSMGEWAEADHLSAAALRGIATNLPYPLLLQRADVDLGRGDFGAARSHLDAAHATLGKDRVQGVYDMLCAELHLWERRWQDADLAVREGLAAARSRPAARHRVLFCAKGLRALAELAVLARARRDRQAARGWLARARDLIAVARSAAATTSATTPDAAGWLGLAEAEYSRARGEARPEAWSGTAEAWERLERPPLVAYCRWREAEAMVATGAPRMEAGRCLHEAWTIADRLGARPLLRELELLAVRARLDLTPPSTESPKRSHGFELLGLTPREAEVLTLVARGLTNREIAAVLVISEKTAGVHVSHILRKLDAPTRREAAAIAHRVSTG